ncbi:microcystin-dependent protein [Fontibacillus solani]|uniref:Microcystin-dependent protein n=1 Tax=Fontibacillus solani TaxID=1572857 RepID=A0A7W3XQB0_9BACL|nr:tail fiber protein [Fontibacillus solani]MBA9084186.1 microcystin-dependent protein [Fontibacillus solani]
MSEPFLGEIRLFPFGYAPRGWAACDGQILQINTNQALYSLLGTTYGGNGTTTFALPDFRGRTSIHTSPNYPLGQSSGEAAHQLTINEMPAHSHQVHASSSAANAVSPQNNTWASSSNTYTPIASGSPSPLNSGAISITGNSNPHSNMQPYLSLNFCIAIYGIYPSRD